MSGIVSQSITDLRSSQRWPCRVVHERLAFWDDETLNAALLEMKPVRSAALRPMAHHGKTGEEPHSIIDDGNTSLDAAQVSAREWLRMELNALVGAGSCRSLRA